MFVWMFIAKPELNLIICFIKSCINIILVVKLDPGEEATYNMAKQHGKTKNRNGRLHVSQANLGRQPFFTTWDRKLAAAAWQHGECTPPRKSVA